MSPPRSDFRYVLSAYNYNSSVESFDYQDTDGNALGIWMKASRTTNDQYLNNWIKDDSCPFW